MSSDERAKLRKEAAYKRFENKRIPLLQKKHPTFDLQRVTAMVQNEWKHCPSNPQYLKLNI